MNPMNGFSEQRATDGEEPVLAYATPKPLAEKGPIYREGELLVVRDGTELPQRCVVCGESRTVRSVPLRFTWDASFTVTRQKPALELRQTGSVRAFLCGSHYRQWAAGRVIGVAGMTIGALLMLTGVVLATVSESSDVPRWTGAGIGVLIGGFGIMILSLFIFALRTRTMECQRIDTGYLYLAGAGEEFLRGV